MKVIDCVRHPGQPGERTCRTCGGAYCVYCTTQRSGRGGTIQVCPECRGKGRLEATKASGSAGELAGELAAVWSYPVADQGWVSLLAGTVVGTILTTILKFGGFIMLIYSAPLALGLVGFVWLWLLRVVSWTAEGNDTLPEWPDFTSLWPLAANAFGLFLLLGMCLLPAVAAATLGVGGGWVLTGSGRRGRGDVPMGVVARAMGGGLAGLGVTIVLPSILLVGRGYLVAIGALVAIMVVRLVVQRLLGEASIVGG